MKLAILGSSPIALEAAVRFHLHGASLTWFNFDEMEYESDFQDHLPADAYISEQGLSLMQEQGIDYKMPPQFSFSYWKDHYWRPLISILSADQKVRPHEVVSVSKRFLGPQEEVAGSSRFHDLFRLIFSVNPEAFISEQEASNPETFERLSAEFKESLQSNLEMYEDFDLVLDLRRSVKPGSVSITGRALGESKVSRDQLKYGLEALAHAHEINSQTLDVKEIALIGSGPLAAQVMLTLRTWIKDPSTRIFIVSEELIPFEHYLEHGDKKSVQSLGALFQTIEDEFQQDITEFHHKLREWQELDDFIQVKFSKPVEPIPRLVYFSGHNATGVDQLIDKRRLFLTAEKPDFRQGLKQPENNLLDLKTIGVDRILVANAMSRSKLDVGLQVAEVGFYGCEVTLPNVHEAWEKDSEKLKGIEHEIFKLFSPADSH